MVRVVITVAFQLLLGPVSPVLFANSVTQPPLVAGKRPAVSLYEEYTLYSLDTSVTSLLPGRALSSLSNVAMMLPTAETTHPVESTWPYFCLSPHV